MDSRNQPPLRDASRRLWEIAREHLRATPRAEESRAAVDPTTASFKKRRDLEARIRRRVDAIIGQASWKTLLNLDGALSLFERRLGTEDQTDAR